VSRGRLPSVLAAAAVCALLAGPAARAAAAADAPTKQQCVVANESAQDLQRAGKLIEARLRLLTCADDACPGAVRADCAEQLQAVGKALPTIVLVPKDAGGADANGAALAIDGVAQPAALDGTPVPLDPGPHTLTVTLTGWPPVSLRLTVRPGDRVRRDVVFRGAPPVATKGARPGGEATAAGEGTTDERPVSSHAAAEREVVNMRRIGWAAIGAGSAGMTLGTVFGFLALARKVSLDSACRSLVCPPASDSDIEGMHVNGVAANISFAVGLLGLGAGGALLLLYPEGPPAEAPRTGVGAVSVRPWAGLGDVGVRGTFR
jgi:hypothetical protein